MFVRLPSRTVPKKKGWVERKLGWVGFVHRLRKAVG